MSGSSTEVSSPYKEKDYPYQQNYPFSLFINSPHKLEDALVRQLLILADTDYFFLWLLGKECLVSQPIRFYDTVIKIIWQIKDANNARQAGPIGLTMVWPSCITILQLQITISLIAIHQLPIGLTNCRFFIPLLVTMVWPRCITILRPIATSDQLPNCNSPFLTSDNHRSASRSGNIKP